MQKWLLTVERKLGRHIEVLHVFLAVEDYVLSLNNALLVDLVTHQHKRNFLDQAGQVAVPLWNLKWGRGKCITVSERYGGRLGPGHAHMLIGNPRGDIKHDDGTAGLDVEAVAET